MGKGNNFWLDDPEWEMIRRRAENLPISKRLRQQARPAQERRRVPSGEAPQIRPSQDGVKKKEVTVNLSLTLPKVKLPNVGRLLRRHRKRLIAGGVLAAVCIVTFGALKILHKPKTTVAGDNGGGQEEMAKQQAQAEFNPLVPLDSVSKPEYKYDAEKKVLGYVADFEGVSITVSQQKLPDQVKEGKTDVGAIAQSLKATKTLTTQNGTAYFATDEKTKTQTAIFSTDEVLVFIRSNKPLGDEEWKHYINQLHTDK